MSYFKKRWKQYFPCGVMFVFFNVYFSFLMQEKEQGYLQYFDFLLALFLAFYIGIDYYVFWKHEREKAQLLQQEDVICEQFLENFENRDIAEHDVRVLKEQLWEKFEENCELQDYVAKWCHEFKIPLAAGLLMEEKIADGEIRRGIREQLEKMNQQINSMILGCRLQSPLFDLQIKKTLLSECVRASIKNNQFFLIRKRFELSVKAEGVSVYTDPAWLVYILDQLINNALKYAGEAPLLHIWPEWKEKSVWLFVEDNGEGIKECDLRRVFEKGFTGSNYHNGKYKSTGMGLYMVKKIIDRLGHEIYVESEYGVYTRFGIKFM